MAADERIETIGQALKGVASDPQWLKKSALGALITMIPYVGAVWVSGFGLHYQRALAWGRGDEPLPEWKRAEPQLKTGLYAFVVGLVYSLPLSLLMTVLLVVGMTAGILGTAASEDVVWVIAGTGVAFVAFLAVSVLYSIVLWPVYVHVQLYDAISAGFEFKRIFSLAKRNAGVFWTAARRAVLVNLISMGAALLVMMVGIAVSFALALGVLPPEAVAVMSLLMMPVQLVIGALSALVTVPLMLAVNRLWAGYARTAYGLEPTAERQPDTGGPVLETAPSAVTS